MGVGGQCYALVALRLGMTRYLLYRRLGGPEGRSGRVWKISPTNGIRSPDRPVRSSAAIPTELYANIRVLLTRVYIRCLGSPGTDPFFLNLSVPHCVAVWLMGFDKHYHKLLIDFDNEAVGPQVGTPFLWNLRACRKPIVPGTAVWSKAVIRVARSRDTYHVRQFGCSGTRDFSVRQKGVWDIKF
jgi:hypothetical protein